MGREGNLSLLSRDRSVAGVGCRLTYEEVVIVDAGIGASLLQPSLVQPTPCPWARVGLMALMPGAT